MPIRRRLCQEVNSSSRRIAHNGVWITDDVLCDAFNRFLRFSNGAKRYGSNVPGPLEAQRRLAKRRMMALAGTGAAPAVDPAMLFGMEGPKMEKMVWQAPGEGRKTETKRYENNTANTSWMARLGLKPAQTSSSVVDEALTPLSAEDNLARNVPSKPSLLSSWLDMRSRLQHASVAEMVELASKAQVLNLDYVEFRQRAFRSLLWGREIKWKHVLEFLLNPQLNVPEARHLTYLASQLGARGVVGAEFEAAKQLIEGCLKLGLVSEEEMPELIDAAVNYGPKLEASMTKASRVSETVDSPLCFIDAVWRGMKACRIKSIPTNTATLILEKLPHTKSLRSFRMELYQHIYPIEENADGTQPVEEYLASWAIQAFGSESSTAMNFTVLVDIIAGVATTVVTQDTVSRATKILLEKLTRLNSISTSGVHDWDTILNGWLISLHKALAYGVWSSALEVIASRNISPLDLIGFFSQLTPTHLMCEALLRYWFPKLPVPPTFAALKQHSLHYNDAIDVHTNSQKLSADVWMSVLQDFRFLHQERYRNSPLNYDAFTYLLIALHRRHQITIVNQQMLLYLCEQRFGPRSVSQVCAHARAAGVYFYPVPMAEIISRLAREHPRVALSLYKSRSIYVHRVPDLLCTLIKAGVHSLDIFKILHQSDPRHHVPLENRCDFRNSLTLEKIDMLHNCADAFSRQEQYSPRVRFRNVYLCYQYLDRRGAPMYPLMSRALVRAGITNYLTTGINVGKKQVKWVLDMVERIEGYETAQELDILVWRWLEKVYRAWSNQWGKMKRPQIPLHRNRRLRSSSGLLKGTRAWAWEMDHGKLPRRLRWYLSSGRISFSNLDSVFHKRLQLSIARHRLPSEWKHTPDSSSTVTQWAPIKATEVDFEPYDETDDVEDADSTASALERAESDS